MNDISFDLGVDIVTMAVISGCNVEWRDNTIIIYLPEGGSLNG